MKILMTIFVRGSGLHAFCGYGGIVPHVELLTKGLRKIGHEVDFALLRCSAKENYLDTRKAGRAGSYPSVVAREVNVYSGWYGAQVISYGSEERLSDWKKIASGYDGILHQLPTPVPDEAGYWRKVYDVDVPQVAIAHDAHFRKMYPYLIDVADKLVAVSTTNEAGYRALAMFPGNRCFIGAPHIPRDWEKQVPFAARKKQFISAHVWKKWKRMDKVVRVLPEATARGIGNILGGDGIELAYLRAKERSRPEYAGLWDAAVAAGANYVGLLSASALVGYYDQVRVMMDMSFSSNFHKLGNHFNRSLIESYNAGVVPLVTTENMEEREDVKLFKDGLTHVGVPKDASVKVMADALESAVFDEKQAERIITAGRAILREHFHYKESAEHFAKLLSGETKVGIYGKLEKGWSSPAILAARDEVLGKLFKKRGKDLCMNKDTTAVPKLF